MPETKPTITVGTEIVLVAGDYKGRTGTVSEVEAPTRANGDRWYLRISLPGGTIEREGRWTDGVREKTWTATYAVAPRTIRVVPTSVEAL
jgi:hypothetical protein